MDRLNTFIQSLKTANEALREAIEIRGDEVGRMEHFQDLFLGVKDKFMKFRQMAMKYESQVEELQTRLQKDLQKQGKLAEDLRRQIVTLNKAIEEQRSDNERLEDDLKEHVDRLQNLKYLSDNSNAYTNASPNMTDPLIHPLCNDLNRISLKFPNSPTS